MLSFSDSEALDKGLAPSPAERLPRPRSAPCRSLPRLDLDDMTCEAVELFRCGQQQVGQLVVEQFFIDLDRFVEAIFWPFLLTQSFVDSIGLPP